MKVQIQELCRAYVLHNNKLKVPQFLVMRTMTNLKDLSTEQKKAFLESLDTVITDCNGVLWHGNVPIPGAVEVMNDITKNGKRRFFFTNNNTLTRSMFVDHLKKQGITATENEVINTAWLTAQYLKSQNFTKKVYLIGPKSVEEELKNVGIDSVGVGADNYEAKCQYVTISGIDASVTLDPGVGAVVIGFDNFFSYPKMLKACSYLTYPGCLFIATNTDDRYPVGQGLTVPVTGTGAFVAALETGSERKATIMGKPSTFAVDVALKSQIDPKRSLMIGDRCGTDIHFGNRAGMTTLLVETGVHKESHVKQFLEDKKQHLVPTYFTASIADLLEILKL